MLQNFLQRMGYIRLDKGKGGTYQNKKECTSFAFTEGIAKRL